MDKETIEEIIELLESFIFGFCANNEDQCELSDMYVISIDAVPVISIVLTVRFPSELWTIMDDLLGLLVQKSKYSL